VPVFPLQNVNVPDRYIILQPSILLIYHYYFIKFVYT